MTARELIAKLQEYNLEGTVWISDQQGGGGPANRPYVVKKYTEFNSGETAREGDIIVSFENT